MYTDPSAGFNNIVGGTSEFAGVALAGILAFVAVIGLIVLVIAILTIIINWKLLTKMGNEGWKALIPVYNTWSICEGIGIFPHWSWITVVASAVLGGAAGIGALVASVITIYFGVIYNIALARSFGKEDSYAVLLFFFFPIVGFFLLKNDYLGAKGCHDIVMDDWFKLHKNNSDEAQVVSETKTEDTAKKESKFCSACGKELKEDSKFCPSCGKEI